MDVIWTGNCRISWVKLG